MTYNYAPALIGADTFSGALSRAAGENVGSYAIGQGTLALNANYSISFVTGSNLVITALGIAVTADAKTKVYGTADPALTYGYTPALIGMDSFTGALSRTAGASVGSYAINQGTLALSGNYTLGYTSSNLVITAAALGITASNTNKALGVTITFVGTEFTSSGLVGGDSVTSVSLASAGAASGAAAGSYSIVPSAASGTGLGNYAITYTNGTLTVTGSADTSLTNIVNNLNGTVTLTFTGSDGVTYRIQSSTDLTNPTWTDVSTNTVSGGSSSFTDANTPDAAKFYRVVFP